MIFAIIFGLAFYNYVNDKFSLEISKLRKQVNSILQQLHESEHLQNIDECKACLIEEGWLK